MSRRSPADLTRLQPPPADTGARGVRVVTLSDLGDVVRSERALRLGRQAETAERLGLGLGTLAALERGDRGVRMDTVLRVLADLGLDVVVVPRDRDRSLRGRSDG
jgi:HTH-type transcriptional regulator/antitoxin HipB